MPYVNLQITAGVTRAQKAELVRRFTEVLVDVLGKRPEHTHIVIQEIPDENWGFSGVLTDKYRGSIAENASASSIAPVLNPSV